MPLKIGSLSLFISHARNGEMKKNYLLNICFFALEEMNSHFVVLPYKKSAILEILLH